MRRMVAQNPKEKPAADKKEVDYCQDIFSAFSNITAGSEIKIDQSVSQEICPIDHDQLSISLPIYSTSSSLAPYYIDTCKKVGSLVANLPKPGVSVDVSLFFGGTFITVTAVDRYSQKSTSMDVRLNFLD